MNVLDQKKLLIERILPYLTGAPSDAVNRLLQKSVSDLEQILDDAITKKERAEAVEHANQYADDMRRESRLEGAWTHALRNVWLNGKQRLVDCESNRSMLENSLQPHEEPSASIYSTIALTYPTKFSWEQPRPVKTDADREAEFIKVCHENQLSLCDANRQLFKDGVALENFAGASGLERAAFQAEAQAARQKFLIHSASPTQLKQEAAWESQQNKVQAQSEDATRQHQFELSQQGHYPPLPATNENGEVMDARWLRKTSTINFPLFKALVKKHGTGNLNSRLRGEN